MQEFYSYQVEQSQNGSFSYTFITEEQTIYSINFDPSEYQDHLQDFPVLLQNGYSFSIFCFPVIKGEKQKYDPQISFTFFKIVDHHFKECGKESVLLFHCDSSDNRQKGRHVLFNKWYKKSANDLCIKESLEVEIQQEPPVKHYIGYITMKANPFVETLIEEFASFSFHIIGSKLNM